MRYFDTEEEWEDDRKAVKMLNVITALNFLIVSGMAIFIFCQ